MIMEWHNMCNKYRFVGYRKFSPAAQESIKCRIEPHIDISIIKESLTQLRKHYEQKDYKEGEIHSHVYVLTAIEKERWLHYKVYVVCHTQHSSIRKCIYEGILELVSPNNTKQENQDGAVIKEEAEMFKWVMFTDYDAQDLPKF
jgi:hypothetical protein